MKDNYRGDEGRRALRMAVINMRDRDGLHGRLEYIRCPVLWLHVSRNLSCILHHIICLLIQRLGRHGCTDPSGKCGERNQIVQELARRSSTYYRGWPTCLELFASAGG
jgi:hypothetical protein